MYCLLYTEAWITNSSKMYYMKFCFTYLFFKILLYLPWNRKVVVIYPKHSIQCAHSLLKWCATALWSLNEIWNYNEKEKYFLCWNLDSLPCWYCYWNMLKQPICLLLQFLLIRILYDGTYKRIVELLPYMGCMFWIYLLDCYITVNCMQYACPSVL